MPSPDARAGATVAGVGCAVVLFNLFWICLVIALIALAARWVLQSV